MPESLNNILIMKPSALGDIVLALPALTALRKTFPDAKISWLVRPEFAPLLENHPHLDEIIPFDRNLLAKSFVSRNALGALFRLIRKLHSSKFDVVFDLQGLFRTALLTRATSCKKIYGMLEPREMAHLFYTYQIKHDFKCIHLVDFYLKMVNAAIENCGISVPAQPEVHFELPVSQIDTDSVNEKLKNLDIQPDRYVVFVPGSAHVDKCWPAERFAELADRISSEFNLPIIAVGTKSETALIEKIQNAAKTKIASLAGQTSLKELVELLRAARLVVSNDTGPGHIASALGTPLVMMYSWSNPARIAPYGRLECMVAREPYGRGLKIKSKNPKHSIKTITIDEVFQKAREQLNSY